MSRYHGPQGKGAARRLRERRRVEPRAKPAVTCPTGKRVLASEKEAQAELVGTLIGANRGNPNRKETRWYDCPLCKGWHLTSKEERA